VTVERPVSLEPRFGLFMSQANKPLAQVLDEFTTAEELGFDHAWLVDHLVDTAGPPENPCLEAWTLLAAIAARTTRIRLGVLVSSNTFRHPSLLLKQAVTVDHVSEGRLVLGIGTGWHEDEHRRYGIPMPSAVERVDRLEEAVQIARLLMSEPSVTFRGTYYQLEDAVFEPRPVQPDGIPILIAAHRPRMIAIAARYADQWDTFPELPGTATEGVTESIADRIARFEAAGRAAGRDPSTVRRSLWATEQVFQTEDGYVDFVRHHASLGFTDFTTVLPPAQRERTLAHLARHVVPSLRRELSAPLPPEPTTG